MSAGTYTLIGGQRHMDSVTILHGTSVQLPLREPAAPVPGPVPITPEPVKFETYTLRNISYHGETLTFMALEGLTDEEALYLLSKR